MSEPSRLARIEEQLDRLTEVVAALARVDEKILGLMKANEILDKKYEDLDERTSKLELDTALHIRAYGNLSKVFWAVLTSSITAGVIWFVSKHFINSPQ